MEIRVQGLIAYVEVVDYCWSAYVPKLGHFKAVTLGDLIDLIKLNMEA